MITAHSADIFTLVCTPTQIISGSGSPDIKIHSTTDPSFILAQVLESAHPLGTHHIAISRNFHTLVSVGFGGEAKIWCFIDGIWKNVGVIPAVKKAGELWAIALDEEGKFLVGTTYDGRVNVWELQGQIDEKSGNEQLKANSFATWETRGGYGLAVDVVSSIPSMSLSMLSIRLLGFTDA